MQEINTNLRNCRNKYEKIKTQFESVQAKRYKLFLDSLECVATEIDSIYKVGIILNYILKFCLFLCVLLTYFTIFI